MFIEVSITNSKDLNNLYKDYFQKSKVFLYPLLGIKKGVRFVPAETYMSWNGIHGIEDNHLICVYEVDDKLLNKYQIFEDQYIRHNKKFKYTIDLENRNKKAIVFDLSRYKNDINKLIKGEYSKISKKTKEIIADFFGEHGTIAEYVESYLHPTYWHEDYAELLNVNIEMIQDVHELCDLPNLNKEDFKYKSTELELLKEKFISLQR